MALIPFLFDDADPWRQRGFGWADELARSLVPRSFMDLENVASALQDAAAVAGPAVTVDKDRIQARFDVQHFKPEEINVKVGPDGVVTVEGEHQEKRDEHGQIYRHFVRKYKLPKGCDVSKLESRLSTDGVLSITAPKVGEVPAGDRTVPIVKTGKPAKSIENKKMEE